MYLLIVRFPYSSHKLCLVTQKKVYCFGLVIMCNYMHAYLEACMRYCMLIWWDLFLSEPLSTCTAFMCARAQRWMCVRAANALMRLCICPDSSELSMLAYKINRQVCLISWHVFQIVFCDFITKEEAIACLKKKPILVRYQCIFYTN